MHVFSNLAISLDGKIATQSRVHFPLGTPLDRKRMLGLRKKSDVVLFGAATLRAYKKPCGTKGGNPWNAVVSSKLEGFSQSWPFFQDPLLNRILFVSSKTPATRIKSFGQNSEVIILDPARSAGKQMISALKSRGAKRILVEGGGSVMWDFAAENLIDEYYVTLTPRILGGTRAPTLVDGPGFVPSDVLNLRLNKVEKIGNELYLVYSKTQKRG